MRFIRYDQLLPLPGTSGGGVGGGGVGAPGAVVPASAAEASGILCSASIRSRARTTLDCR